MLERMKTETTLNVYQMVCSIRKKRPLLVQADVRKREGWREGGVEEEREELCGVVW